MRITFVRDTDPSEHGFGDGFKKDQTVSISERSGLHWINLGAAVEAGPEPVVEETAPADVPPVPVPAPPAPVLVPPVQPAGTGAGTGGQGEETDDKGDAGAEAEKKLAEAAAAEAKRLAAIEIAPAWKNMPIARRLDLAMEISGRTGITDKGEADDVIAAEVARREAK